jgi:hypothetical protein
MTNCISLATSDVLMTGLHLICQALRLVVEEIISAYIGLMFVGGRVYQKKVSSC